MVEQSTELSNADRQLIPASLTIMALRDSRYHNTAYALSELIDNSVDANSDRVEVLCMERTERVNIRNREIVSEIAVLDNGVGMSPQTLLDALKFGGGTRHFSHRGIGKYGMGLPTSSVSQCEKVDVWTWQNGGFEKPWHCYIDVVEVRDGQDQVPFPDQETPIPPVWLNAALPESINRDHGTLVQWTKLDRIQWRESKALIDNTATEIGRIHRYSIQDGKVSIRMASFPEHQPRNPRHDTHVLPNDPTYLMHDTSTPKPWDNSPMFKEWASKPYTVKPEGKEETIEVRYSIVKPEALKTASVGQPPGAEPHGRHARHNIGVSVVREDREIVLEDAFLREGGSSTNPENRWWGCEVRFSRNCDELFGVDHNKQLAIRFTQAAKLLAQDDRPSQVILDEVGVEEDEIHRIVADIRNETRAMMRAIRQMFDQRRNSYNNGDPNRTKRPDIVSIETASKADQNAISQGVETPTDTDQMRDQTPPNEREEALTKQYADEGLPLEDARSLAQQIIQHGHSYQFRRSQLDGYQMFNVRSNQGVLHINLNTDHDIYDLIEHIDDEIDETADENDPAFQASVAIKLLLLSWARMEDQTEAREERIQIQNISNNWGRQSAKLLRQWRDRTS